MQTLKPGHLEEDCPITTFSQKKRFSSVFADRPIIFKYSTMQLLKFLKPFELTWPIRKQPSNWWLLLHGPYAKKIKKPWRNYNIFKDLPQMCINTSFFPPYFFCPFCTFSIFVFLSFPLFSARLFYENEGLHCLC